MSIFALAIGCTAIPTSVATAYPIPKRAVFEGTPSEEFTDFGIWVSRQDGSEPEEIADHSSREAVLSPDGLEVAFTHDGTKKEQTCIDLMAINGTLNKQNAVAVYCQHSGLGPAGLAWSPNGYELAFSGTGASGPAILVLNLKTEKLRTVADWYATQQQPTFSPDGEQIAFESNYTPENELAYTIWIVNTDGTGLHQLTKESYLSRPAWSPDGSQIAVSGSTYEEEINEDEGGIALLNSGTGVIEKWLLAEDGLFEYDPHWTTNGSLTYTRWSYVGGPFNERPEVGEINVDGTEEHYVLPEFFWAEQFRPQETTGEIEPDPSYLLTHYEPRLHYDLQEDYFADSAAEATEGPENRILASDRETVLAAHEAPYVTPSLSLLAEPEFAYGVIDEGPEYGEDSAYLHANPELANQDYGRVHQDPETGAWWLDYWFYYYYDSQEVLGIGVHEGDWEHIALRLDEEGIPDLAVYSRHGSESAACESSAVEWEVSDTNTVSPNVYVANGSHANYFRAGEHGREFPLPTDDANGDGGIVTPKVAEVEDAPYTSSVALPRWFYWTGKWGASEGEGFDQASPSSPARNSNEWEDLQAFAEASEGNCDAEGLGERPVPQQRSNVAQELPRPSAPEISAEGTKDDGIAVRYKIPNNGAPAKFILLSVTAKNKLDATRIKTIPLRADQGVAHLPRPLFDGPYIAAGSTFTGRKARSETRVANVAP